MNKTATLILIDMQQGFDESSWGPRNNPGMENVLREVLGKWREARWPVFHVKHHSTEPNSTLRPDYSGSALKPGFTPANGEPLIVKSVNSGFIGTDLEHQLRQRETTRLVLGGLTTNHCVSTTARMAGNLGFETTVLSDGTATFDRQGINGEVFGAQVVHDVSLANLHQEFATVCKAQDVLEQLPSHPRA